MKLLFKKLVKKVFQSLSLQSLHPHSATLRPHFPIVQAGTFWAVRAATGHKPSCLRSSCTGQWWGGASGAVQEESGEGAHLTSPNGTTDSTARPPYIHTTITSQHHQPHQQLYEVFLLKGIQIEMQWFLSAAPARVRPEYS